MLDWWQKNMKQYITIEKYFDCLICKQPQYKKQLNETIKHNATILCLKINQLFNEIDPKITIPNIISINSGWRPLEYNAMIGGARSSYHCKAMAIDIQDKDNVISNFLVNNQSYLERLNIRMEHPQNTKDWCHLDIGKVINNRVFYSNLKHKPIKNLTAQKKNDNKYSEFKDFFDDLIEFFIK